MKKLPMAAFFVGKTGAAAGTRRSQGIKKRYKIFSCISLFDCGDRIWTCDLRVMSPTSYRTALLRGSIKWAEKDSNLRSYRNRFTVCPLWPLGNPPMVMESFFDYELPTHDALSIVQGSEWKMMKWFSSVKKKNLPYLIQGIIFSPADKQEKSRWSDSNR